MLMSTTTISAFIFVYLYVDVFAPLLSAIRDCYGKMPTRWFIINILNIPIVTGNNYSDSIDMLNLAVKCLRQRENRLLMFFFPNVAFRASKNNTVRPIDYLYDSFIWNVRVICFTPMVIIATATYLYCFITKKEVDVKLTTKTGSPTFESLYR